MWLYGNVLFHISYQMAGYLDLLNRNQPISNTSKRSGNFKIQKNINQINIIFKLSSKNGKDQIFFLFYLYKRCFDRTSSAPFTTHATPVAIATLNKAFNEDKNPKKLNLGEGTVRDKNGNPYKIHIKMSPDGYRWMKESVVFTAQEYF